jgi:ATP-dependent Clp protease ATP-binding subunit ClpX
MKLAKNLKPSLIKKILDESVIDQNMAKEIISVAIYNHYKMNKYIDEHNGKPPINIERANVILLGPTGCGKTELLRTLSRELGLPLGISDATTLTEAGYVGEDVENCIRRVIEAAENNVKKAETGICYIDEIDKLGRKGENMSISRDVSGEGVQQALLKIVEGTDVEVPPKGGRKHPDQECVKINTSRMLFIVGGSFEGIEKIIAKRKQGDSTMGFGAKVVDTKNTVFNEHIESVTVDDLKRFGMIPEFLGRFPNIAPLKELTVDALIDILTKPKNAIIKQYKELFKMDGVKLEFTEDALVAIAEKAIERKTGARSLRSIVENTLLKYMYKLPDLENVSGITISKEVVEGKAEATLTYKETETDAKIAE